MPNNMQQNNSNSLVTFCCVFTMLLAPLWLSIADARPVTYLPQNEALKLAQQSAQEMLARGQWSRVLALTNKAINNGSRDIDTLGSNAIAGAVLGKSQIVEQALLQLKRLGADSYYSELVQSIIELQQDTAINSEKRLKALLEEHPGDPLLLYFWGELQALSGEKAQALKTFQTVLEKVPEFTPALIAKAQLLPQEKINEAVSLLEQAASISPGNIAYRRELIVLYNKAGRQKEADKLYKDLLMSMPGVKEQYLEQAWQLLQSGNNHEALKQIDKTVNYWGPQPLGYLIQVMAYINLGENIPVDKILEDYLNTSQSVHAHYAAGLCELARAQYVRAGQYFQTSLEDQPSNVKAYTNLVVVAQATGNRDRARAIIKQVASVQKDTGTVNFLTANMKLAEGKFDEYRRYLKNTNILLPGSENLKLNLPELTTPQQRVMAVQHNLMLIMFLNHWYSQAIRFADKALQIAPVDTIALYFRTLSYEAQGKFKQAHESAKLLVAKEPRFIGAHLAFARIMSKTATPEATLTAYTSLLKMAPDFVPAHIGIANTYLKLDQKDYALKALAKAETVAKTGNELFQLALGFQRTGAHAKSRELLIKALDTGNTGSWRTQTTEMLNLMSINPDVNF